MSKTLIQAPQKVLSEIYHSKNIPQSIIAAIPLLLHAVPLFFTRLSLFLKKHSLVRFLFLIIASAYKTFNGSITWRIAEKRVELSTTNGVLNFPSKHISRYILQTCHHRFQPAHSALNALADGSHVAFRRQNSAADWEAFSVPARRCLHRLSLQRNAIFCLAQP